MVKAHSAGMEIVKMIPGDTVPATAGSENTVLVILLMVVLEQARILELYLYSWVFRLYMKGKMMENDKSVIVIADQGWIFVGTPIQSTESSVSLASASVVRCWYNGLGIGGLADLAHKDDYTLDYVGLITIRAVTAVIECAW